MASAAAPAGAARLPPRPAAARAGSTSPAAGSGLAGLGSAAHHRRRSSGPPPPAPQLRAEQRRQAGIEEGVPATVADVCGGSRGQRADGGSKGRGGVCAASGRAARRRGRGAAAPRWIRRWGRTSGAGDWEKGDRGRKRAGEEEGESREWGMRWGEEICEHSGAHHVFGWKKIDREKGKLRST